MILVHNVVVELRNTYNRTDGSVPFALKAFQIERVMLVYLVSILKAVATI